jgi:hypothetical protein
MPVVARGTTTLRLILVVCSGHDIDRHVQDLY